MAVGEFIKAVVVTMIFIGIGAGIVWFIVLLWKKSLITYFIKYKILRNKYDQKDLEWCERLKQDFKDDEVGFKIFLLQSGTPMKKIDEMTFIFRNLKGGDAKR